MRAVVLVKAIKANQIQLSEVFLPKVQPGWVLVKVKAFGLNHSEQILREFEIENDYIKKPIIPGIECVGEIVDPSDSDLVKGQKVIALMGGMGRSFDGSYAEYALLPIHHVFSVNTELTWKELGAVPETYYTAWGSLFECLNLQPEDTLLIRGATCALGYAAIQIAKANGCTVYGTTHREDKRKLLLECGADKAILDDENLKRRLSGVTKVLELVGAKTLRDSLLIVEKGGIVCHTGVLGNEYVLNNFDPIKEVPNGVYLTGFYSNMPQQSVIDGIMMFIKEHQLSPCIGASFLFEQIADAWIDMEKGKINGKIVIVVDEK